GEKLLESLQSGITVDLEEVEQSSSVGVSVMLCWLRSARAADKDIRFRAMPAKMFDVARVSGLDDVLPLIENGQSD
ncbi:MAG: STAS domain-containing protein, partial [Ketobacteraceae bacterium]|nr:STAS domain-containing protein [Ketobacteraceae bacterium]